MGNNLVNNLPSAAINVLSRGFNRIFTEVPTEVPLTEGSTKTPSEITIEINTYQIFKPPSTFASITYSNNHNGPATIQENIS
jgi:hypothetical protein